MTFNKEVYKSLTYGNSARGLSSPERSSTPIPVCFVDSVFQDFELPEGVPERRHLIIYVCIHIQVANINVHMKDTHTNYSIVYHTDNSCKLQKMYKSIFNGLVNFWGTLARTVTRSNMLSMADSLKQQQAMRILTLRPIAS